MKNELLPIHLGFKPPFRVGKAQNRAILDDNGHEVIVFNKGLELMAKNYCDFLNSSSYDIPFSPIGIVVINPRGRHDSNPNE